MKADHVTFRIGVGRHPATDVLRVFLRKISYLLSVMFAISLHVELLSRDFRFCKRFPQNKSVVLRGWCAFSAFEAGCFRKPVTAPFWSVKMIL